MPKPAPPHDDAEPPVCPKCGVVTRRLGGKVRKGGDPGDWDYLVDVVYECRGCGIFWRDNFDGKPLQAEK